MTGRFAFRAPARGSSRPPSDDARPCHSAQADADRQQATGQRARPGLRAAPWRPASRSHSTAPSHRPSAEPTPNSAISAAPPSAEPPSADDHQRRLQQAAGPGDPQRPPAAARACRRVQPDRLRSRRAAGRRQARGRCSLDPGRLAAAPQQPQAERERGHVQQRPQRAQRGDLRRPASPAHATLPAASGAARGIAEPAAPRGSDSVAARPAAAAAQHAAHRRRRTSPRSAARRPGPSAAGARRARQFMPTLR